MKEGDKAVLSRDVPLASSEPVSGDAVLQRYALKRHAMRDPMTFRSQFVRSRLFKSQSIRYHALHIGERTNRIYLCGCMGAIRLSGRDFIHCGKRVSKDARFNRYFASHSIWS
jgi:hypothetical protein